MIIMTKFIQRNMEYWQTGGLKTEPFRTWKRSKAKKHTKFITIITLMYEPASNTKNKYKNSQLRYIKLTPIYINEILYADDLLLIPRNKEGLINKINRMDWGLKRKKPKETNFIKYPGEIR